MDKRGHEALNTALDSEFGATVLPEPAEDENVRYLTIKTSEQVVPAAVLNALGQASLMQVVNSNGYEDAVPQYRPSLKLLGITPGELTFEDVNTPGWTY